MYKVYSKSQKKKLDARDYGLTGDGQILEYLWYDEIGWAYLKSSEKQDIVFCLGSGLKDCNYNEIYEGDIVKVESWKTETEVGIVNCDAALVEFGYLGWTITKINPHYRERLTSGYKYTIIGNKFENPELLKQ